VASSLLSTFEESARGWQTEEATCATLLGRLFAFFERRAALTFRNDDFLAPNRNGGTIFAASQLPPPLRLFQLRALDPKGCKTGARTGVFRGWQLEVSWS